LSTLHKISGCDSEARKADVIFIHGLGGDAFGTWRHGDDNSSLWPGWLGQEFVDEIGVWSLGYAASPSKWLRVLGGFSRSKRDAGYGMPLPTRAGQVLDSMVQHDIGRRPILFICHSLGGLLAKQILRKANDAVKSPSMQQVAHQTRAVLFLATPHAGADLASRLDDLRTIFGTTASIEDLREHSAHLSDLYDWYCDHASTLGIETKTYYEMRPIGGVLPIVNPGSARSGVGANPVGLDEDHLSIAKPPDKNAQVCRAALDLLRNYVLTVSRARPVPQPTPPPPNRTEVIETAGRSFRKEGRQWIEYPPYEPGSHFTFDETSRDNDYIYLTDPTRTKPNEAKEPMLVRLPIKGGMSHWSYSNPVIWNDFTVAAPIKGKLSIPKEPFAGIDSTDTAVAKSTKNIPAQPILSREAKILLKKASNGGGGIQCIDAVDGWVVQVDGTNFVESGNPRSVATWRSVINEIARSGFVQGGGDGLYHLTREGYDFADLLSI
jgi:pimeloyl-ACP methyl ester carboxylesterase